ncbi:MAG: hypothetical protein AB7O62_11085 [Pirellulales bacterium]
MARLHFLTGASLLLALAGCGPMLKTGAGTTLLTQPKLSSDTAVLELCSVRLTEAKAIAASGLWPRIDEQVFPAELRRKLAENGFQAGVVGPHLPEELQTMLAATDASPESPGDNEASGNTLSEKPRHKHFRSGIRHEFITSDVQDSFALLLREDGQLRGRSFAKGQGLLAVKAFPRGDGLVRLEITPELHYGEEKHQYRTDGELILMQPGRRRETLDQFLIDVNLSAGQVLVLGCRPDMPGSAGQRFFSEKTSTGTLLRMMLIRVAQTQHDDLFGESPDDHDQ